MDKLIDVLNWLGKGVVLPLPHSDDPIFMFALIILVLSVCSLLGFINIMVYFFTLLYFDTPLIQRLIMKGQKFGKIIKFYKQTSMVFITFEIIVYLWFMGSIIKICIKILNTFI